MKKFQRFMIRALVAAFHAFQSRKKVLFSSSRSGFRWASVILVTALLTGCAAPDSSSPTLSPRPIFSQDLLLKDLKSSDSKSAWKPSNRHFEQNPGYLASFERDELCGLVLFKDFQSAWNMYYQDGAAGSWELYFAKYKDGGVVVYAEAYPTTCVEDLSSILDFQESRFSPESKPEWVPTAANIANCIQIHIACLGDKYSIPKPDSALPGAGFDPLYSLGWDEPFCIFYSQDVVGGALGGCTPVDSSQSQIMLIHSSRTILTYVASSSASESIPDYFVVGEGWVIYSDGLSLEGANKIAERAGGKVFATTSR